MLKQATIWRIFLVATFSVVQICCTAAPDPEPESAYNLGVKAYRVKDYANARVHWARAVEEREPSAFNNLGFLLYFGFGGAEDPDRAVALWKIAAAIGHAEAQWHLAHAFQDGKGTELNLVEAYAWFRCSISSYELSPADAEESEVVQLARTSLTQILPKLSVEQLAAAEQLARQYIDKYSKKAGV